MAGEARDLFERALKMNPSNDSAKIGLGSAYIFGSPAENPQEVDAGYSADPGSCTKGFNQYVCSADAGYWWSGFGAI